MVKQILSHSGKYKAIITEGPDSYCIDVYARGGQAGKAVPDEKQWQKRNRSPVCIVKSLNAEYFALAEMRRWMGDPESPPGIEWLRDYAHNKDVKFLDPDKVVVFFDDGSCVKERRVRTPTPARTIVFFGGFCVVETFNRSWLVGQLNSRNEIMCWAKCTTLKEAIDGG